MGVKVHKRRQGVTLRGVFFSKVFADSVGKRLKTQEQCDRDMAAYDRWRIDNGIKTVTVNCGSAERFELVMTDGSVRVLNMAQMSAEYPDHAKMSILGHPWEIPDAKS